MKRFFEQYITITNNAIDQFPITDPQIYAQFLAQTYYFVSHSTRLLASSAARFTVSQEDLHRRFIAHIAEEKGHHLIAAADLKNLGYDINFIPELPTTKILYETQYYKCEHIDPIALFGYILLLEGISITRGKQLYPILEQKFGKYATGFLRLHVEDDVDHLEKAFNHISNLEEEKINVIKENLEQTCIMYNIFLDGISKNPLQLAKLISTKRSAPVGY